MKIKVFKENKQPRATSEDFSKLLKLAKKEDIETDGQVFNILNGLAQVGLVDDDNREAAQRLYYHYSLRMRKAERYKEVAQHEHDFWVSRNKGNIQDLSGQIKRHADMIKSADQTAKIAGGIVALLKKEKLFEEKEYKDLSKKKLGYEERLIIAVIEDEMTGDVKEKKVRIPMQVLQKADEETAHLPAAMQGEAFDQYVMNYLEEMMQKADLLNWTETLVDYRPGDPEDSFDVNPKPKPYMKDDEFDMLDEAKEDDVKEKYGLEDGVATRDGRTKTFPHFAYNQIVMWVNRDRPKRIKLLDWMGKQIAGSDWKSQEALMKVFKMQNLLGKFIKQQDQMKEKDINKYPSIEALEAAYQRDVLDKIIAKARKGRIKPTSEQGDVVYEDNRFFVVQPKTTKASCYYGANTKWCISQKENEHFGRYTEAGKVFYFIRDDSKKNSDAFYSLAVQYNKYTGKREQLWDRYDNSYGPEDWPEDDYGEESEDAIMGAIQKHFDDNYKGVERTLKSLHDEINNEAFDVDENYSDFLSYDVLFDSQISDVAGGVQKLRFGAEYYIYVTPSPSIRAKFREAGFKEPEGSAKIAEAIQEVFEKRKKQLLQSMFNQFPIQNYDVKILPIQNQINITAERKMSSTDVGRAHEWIMSVRNSAEEDALDMAEAFERAFISHVLEYIENTTKRPSLDESKLKIKISKSLDERCQKGYKTHPTRKTKKMYGKTYRNCIKAEGEIAEADPKKGTGKKPKGSSRRLYTDEDPSDTVSVKFRTVSDIRDTLSKAGFKNKSHKRQSQIINLIHQRVRAAYENAKDPDTKARLKKAYDYAKKRKEASKEKTKRMNKKK